ncbi:MAG TPA: tetratricopeptide repeat protein, partial [Abditibacteriaceae bacterium]|nr:tetratricopeptide repeat protein [Abditibacteriaceae bacterium]
VLRMSAFYVKSKRDYGAVEAAYRKLMRLHPENGQIIVNFAAFYQHLHEYTQAERMYRTAIELNPRWVRPVVDLAQVYRTTKKHDEAERLYLKAVELAPGQAWHITNLAWFYYQVRLDYDAAEREFRKALAIDANSASAINGLGNIYYIRAGNAAGAERQKFLEEAKQFNLQAIALDPTDGRYHADLALNLFRQDRKEEAMAEARQAITLGYKGPHPVFEDLNLTP